MKHIYAVENEEELHKYQNFARQIQHQLDDYIAYLKKEFAVRELPKAILWTSGHTATSEISSIPIPAYTNEFRTVITSDLDTWQAIYLKQLDGMHDNDAVREIRTYYKTALNQNHILQILGHELAHHSELFLEDFNTDLPDGIWFEEGMVEYISRRYFLTGEEFEAESQINQLLVEILTDRYGGHSLEEFGESTYKGDYAIIFFEYWRSFLTVKQLIDQNNGSIHAVLGSYHEWNHASTGQTLAQWFGIEG